MGKVSKSMASTPPFAIALAHTDQSASSIYTIALRHCRLLQWAEYCISLFCVFVTARDDGERTH